MDSPEATAPKRTGRGGTPGNKGGGRKPSPPETHHVRFPGFRLPPGLAAEAEQARLPGESWSAMVKRLFLAGLAGNP
jgi:hypothetical protein